jgi:hypothetical protein
MKKQPKYQGVTGFVGMPGSGKTYSLARIGLDAMKRGERVVCNAGFDLAGAETMATFDEFAALEGPVTVVWDELPLYFNARKWAEFPDAMLYKLTQIRKDGIRLYYSAIHELMIDTTIRRITFWFWHCRALTGRMLFRALYPPQEFRKAASKPYRRKLYVVRDEVASAYDTFGKVKLPKKIRERVGAGVPEEGTWADLAGGPEGAPARSLVVPGGVEAFAFGPDSESTPART